MSPATTLEATERFIAGFEDDASQEGVPQLLADLRASERLLPRMGQHRTVSVREKHGHLTIELVDKAGNEVAFIKRYECPGTWARRWWHPSHWSVHHTRICSAGLRWSATLGRDFVCDDFGNLVEVPA
jgi:hypothetical protein